MVNKLLVKDKGKKKGKEARRKTDKAIRKRGKGAGRKTDKTIKKPTLKFMIDSYGGHVKLAESLGILHSRLSNWLYSDLNIPKRIVDELMEMGGYKEVPKDFKRKKRKGRPSWQKV